MRGYAKNVFTESLMVKSVGLGLYRIMQNKIFEGIDFVIEESTKAMK